jgi:hypothetical protein
MDRAFLKSAALLRAGSLGYKREAFALMLVEKSHLTVSVATLKAHAVDLITLRIVQTHQPHRDVLGKRPRRRKPQDTGDEIGETMIDRGGQEPRRQRRKRFLVRHQAVHAEYSCPARFTPVQQAGWHLARKQCREVVCTSSSAMLARSSAKRRSGPEADKHLQQAGEQCFARRDGPRRASRSSQRPVK